MRRINGLGLASAVALLAAQSQQAIAMNEVRLFKSNEPTVTPFWLSKGKQAAQWKQETHRRPRG